MGWVSVKMSSTSNMINHIRSHHPEMVPSEVPEDRRAPDVHNLDRSLLREWGERMVLKPLQPSGLVEETKCISVLQGLGGKTKLRQEVLS